MDNLSKILNKVKQIKHSNEPLDDGEVDLLVYMAELYCMLLKKPIITREDSPKYVTRIYEDFKSVIEDYPC